MKIAWTTDIRLTEVSKSHAKGFCDRIRLSGVEAVLVGGDISEAWDLESWLRFLDANLGLPIYFVLGNYDYYGSDVDSVRRCVSAIESSNLHWLPTEGVVRLTKDTALVGHGGWADARNGNLLESQVTATDLMLIHDLRMAVNPDGDKKRPTPWDAWLNRPALKRKLNELGDEAATTLQPFLEKALKRFPRVIILTHVPPFTGTGPHKEGSGGDFAPDLGCKAMGDMLLGTVSKHPHREVVVLCGHVQGDAVAPPLSNLRVLMRVPEHAMPDFQTLTFD
jgi:predicted phosphohydrolase